MTIRAFHPYDAAAVAGVFRAAVLSLGAEAYSPAQVSTWAEAAKDVPGLAQRLTDGTTLVAEDDDGIVAAFGQLHPSGHISYLYCAPRFGRQGVGSTLYRRLEATALALAVRQLTVDASRVARAFFARHGFAEVRSECVVRNGIELERFHMVKDIG